MQLVVHNLQAFYQGPDVPTAFQAPGGLATLPDATTLAAFVLNFKSTAARVLGVSDSQVRAPPSAGTVEPEAEAEVSR